MITLNYAQYHSLCLAVAKKLSAEMHGEDFDEYSTKGQFRLAETTKVVDIVLSALEIDIDRF